MAALTQKQVIIEALHDLGVAAIGEQVQPEYLATGQIRFNMLVDDWKTDRLMIYQTLRQVFDVAANTAVFTIGPGGDWVTPTIPLAIVRAGFINSNLGPDQPLETKVHVYTDEEWAAIGLKNLTSNIIWGMWYETSYKQTAPIGTARVFVYPILTTSGQVVLYLPQAIDELPEDEIGLATVLYVPPGYRRGFVASLAMDLADELGIEPSATLVGKWKLAMKRIKRANTKAATLRIPAMLTRRGRGKNGYNILTNE